MMSSFETWHAHLSVIVNRKKKEEKRKKKVRLCLYGNKGILHFDMQRDFVKLVAVSWSKQKLNGLILMNVYLKFTDSFLLLARKWNFLCFGYVLDLSHNFI